MAGLEDYNRGNGWVGPGWEPMVSTLDKFLSSLVPEYAILQVKEKFGGLRFYYSLPADTHEDDKAQVERLVAFVESLSYETCEECGAAGTMLDIGSWWRTLCPNCEVKVREARANLWTIAPDA